MAYASNVNVIPGDFLAVYSGSNTTPARNNPMIYQYNRDNYPIGRALEVNSSALTAVTYPLFSPDGKWLVFINANNIQIINLETGNVATLAASVTATVGTFSNDSSTVVFATGTAPFILAVDVATASLKGTISGTYTFTTGGARGVAYGSKIYLHSYSAATSGANNVIYEYDPASNKIVTFWTTPRAYGIGTIAASELADDFMLVCEGVPSSAGRTYAIKPSEIGGSYATINISNSNNNGNQGSILFKSNSGVYVWMTFIGTSTDAVKFYSISSYATITSTTVTSIAVSGTAGVGANGPQTAVKTLLGVAWISSVTGVSNYPIGFVNLDTYTSGPISISTFDSFVTYLAVHPGIRRRKFAGHVYNASNAPVARTIEVIERKTNRVIASGRSSAVDGSFLIPIYTTEQCLIVAKGNGTEVSKIADYVTPVAM